MAFDLNDFRSKMINGGARPSQFEMRITWPASLRGRISTAENDFRFFCQVSEIPESKVGFFTVPYFGRKLTYAGDRTFAPLTVTVINDENFKIRRALEMWSNEITGHSNTTSTFRGGVNEGSYATDGEVVQYSRNNGGEALQAYRFVGIFPVHIAAIALDWNSTDVLETFTCEFHYQWWEPITTALSVSL